MNYFKELRLAKGMTQKELSKRLGFTTPQFVYSFESRVGIYPSKNCLKKMSRVFEIPTKYLAGYVVELKQKQIENDYKDLLK